MTDGGRQISRVSFNVEYEVSVDKQQQQTAEEAEIRLLMCVVALRMFDKMEVIKWLAAYQSHGTLLFLDVPAAVKSPLFFIRKLYLFCFIIIYVLLSMY